MKTTCSSEKMAKISATSFGFFCGGENTGANVSPDLLRGFGSETLNFTTLRQTPKNNACLNNIELNTEKSSASPRNVYKFTANSCNKSNVIGFGQQEKSSMCRVSELARYHKLKHEYILFDECGPSHRKRFTVRLVLCKGQEFIGIGPSIKKAQQAAAREALEKTTLTAPQPRIRKTKRFESNPVNLLNQVAYQLDLLVEYDDDIICIPVSSNAESLSSSPSMTLSNGPPHVRPNSVPLSLVVPPPQFPLNLVSMKGCVGRSPPPLAQLNCAPFHAAFLPYFNIPPPPPPLWADSRQYGCNKAQLVNPSLSPMFFMQKPNFLPSFNGTPVGPSTTKSDSLIFNSLAALQNPLLQFPFNNGTVVDINCLSKKRNLAVHQYRSGAHSMPKQFYRYNQHMHMPPPVMFPPPFVDFSTFHGQTTMPKNLINNCNGHHSRNVSSTSVSYITTLKLSDGSRHYGRGSTKLEAHSDAAVQALFYLRPALEKLEATLKAAASALKDESADDISSNGPNNTIAEQNAIIQDLSESLAAMQLTCDSECGDDSETDKSTKPEGEIQESVGDKSSEMDGLEKFDVEDDNDSKKGFKKRKKSVISQIHEYALRLSMNVEFDILQEIGEPHNRRFVIRCRLVSLISSQVVEAEGEGNSKKAAKQQACQQIYDKIKQIDCDPLYLASLIVKNRRKSLFCGRRMVKRKTIVKQRRSDPQYGHWINPISRLMQVMQASKKSEPIFRYIGERGQGRYKEFMVEVSCLDYSEVGAGPNKRLAKRAAAELMLQRIGYVKPMPQPGKSLLKKPQKDSFSTEIDSIGGFTPTENYEEKNLPSDEKSLKLEFPDVNNSLVQSNTVSNPGSQEDASSPNSQQHENSSRQCSGSLEGNSDANNNDSFRVGKRRVTFNSHVSACPPPDDLTYPAASIALLKSEVIVPNSKLKKRGRDSKKILSEEEKNTLSSISKMFINYACGAAQQRQLPLEAHISNILHALNNNVEIETNEVVPLPNQSTVMSSPLPIPITTFLHSSMTNANEVPAAIFHILQSAKRFLEIVAKTYRFSVIYSDFPKTNNSKDEQYFSLVTLGIEKPIICSGNGRTEELSHENAALNAIHELSQIVRKALADPIHSLDMKFCTKLHHPPSITPQRPTTAEHNNSRSVQSQIINSAIATG